MHVGPRLNPQAVRAVIPSHKLIRFPYRRGPNKKEVQVRKADRARGRAFRKMSLDYSGMSAKPGLTSVCVTGEPNHKAC